jgi:rRNA small subunit pseudouridine methyltransferase Nep1
LLERGSIKGDVEGNITLLEIVPGPVQQYFPADSKVLGKNAQTWKQSP